MYLVLAVRVAVVARTLLRRRGCRWHRRARVTLLAELLLHGGLVLGTDVGGLPLQLVFGRSAELLNMDFLQDMLHPRAKSTPQS